MIRLAKVLPLARIVDLEATSKDAALAELAGTFEAAPEVTDVAALLAALLERERIVSTGIGLGVAVPHAKIDSVTDFVLAYGRSHAGIAFDSLDDEPVHHVVLIAGPPNQQHRYLQFLATVTLKLKNAELRGTLAAAEDAEALRQALCS